MSDALRELLASFVIEVDKAGELAKGNAAIDALKARLGDLQAEFNKVRAPAERAGKAIQAALQSGFGAAPGLAAALQQSASSATSSLFGQFGAAQGAHEYSSPIGPHPLGPQFGPTRETLNAGRAAMAESEAAAAKFAGTLRGKLSTAVQALKDGFSRGGGGGGDGPGLIDRLSDFRTQIRLLGAGAAIAGIKRLVDGIGDIGEAAQRLGVTTGEFQRLEVLARQNGTSVESLGTAFRTLANVAVEPTKQSTEAFAKLGVSVKDSSGQFKSTNDLFFEVSGALAGVANETTRSALAQDLLGRSAIELKPLFAAGTAEIEKQRKALAAMHVISHETIVQADELSDSWKTLGPSMLAAAEPLIKILIPALKKLTEWVQKGIDWVGKFLRQSNLAGIALTGLAAVLAAKVIPGLQLMIGLGGGATRSLFALAGAGLKAAWSFARMVLPLLLLEDLITFFRGGDSDTGRLLDTIFGKGTADGTLKAVQDLATAFQDLWKWITGDGQGEKAKAFFGELGLFFRTIRSDLLAIVGIGKGGIHGAGVDQPFAQQLFGGGDSIPAPGGGAYGPPTADQAGRAPVTIGDTTVTVNMGPSASAPDVGRAVGGIIDDRNRLVAGAGHVEF
ncbi:MAG TPA: phage tail tape measure protein [Gaiellaceae bacterium]